MRTIALELNCAGGILADIHPQENFAGTQMRGYPTFIEGTEALDHAYKYTSHAWFPADPEIVGKVRGRLGDGTYQGNPALLLDDVKQDFSLYLLCIKDLRALLVPWSRARLQALPATGAAGQTIPANGDALGRIAALIDQRGASLSAYSLDTINDLQTLRLQDCVFSTAAAQTLGSKIGIDTDLAFSAGLLRQLGLILIAWNYPGRALPLRYRREPAAR